MPLSDHAAHNRGMVTLELVNHCWNYWRLATLHLSQLALHPPQACRVTCTIIHAPAADDPRTAEVLAYFSGLSIENVRWNFTELPREQVCRRAIGRNIACKASRADFVLMGDIDYCFGAGALDAAAAEMTRACRREWMLMHPREVWQSIDHARGDAEIERVDRPRLLELTPERYVQVGMPRAIGGAQYCPGDFARKRGYLPESRRFQRPADTWVQTFDDRVFRYSCGMPSTAIEVPNVYRTRHSRRGRFDIGVEL